LVKIQKNKKEILVPVLVPHFSIFEITEIYSCHQIYSKFSGKIENLFPKNYVFGIRTGITKKYIFLERRN